MRATPQTFCSTFPIAFLHSVLLNTQKAVFRVREISEASTQKEVTVNGILRPLVGIMGSSQQFSLRWNNYLKHITSAFDTLRSDEDLVDVTLSCEGKRIRAHKMLLSACSTYFRDLFKENPCQHPVIIFRNVKFDDLAALVDFIYQGEVNVVQEQLDSFMTTAELLAVQGLTDGSRKDDNLADDDVEIPSEPEVQLRNVAGRVITNNRGNKSPCSPLPYHSIDTQKSEAPPNKRRKCRENSNTHSEKSYRHTFSPKNADNAKSDSQTASDPVEIIPLMPNLKSEMPEYLEQDGSSCSYEEQAAGDNSNKLDDNPDILENDQKPDITQTFYSNQSSTDTLDASKSSDIGYLLSKPGTSFGERILHESIQEQPGDTGGSSGPNPDLGAYVDDDNEQSSDSELLFRCRICWKGFKHPISLTLHKDLHTGQTRCPICQRIFSRSYDMRVHLLRIHERTLWNVNTKISTQSNKKK
ncbi:PREDICTED: zinc finger and BTB domain-containing protein 49 isoform X3 [Ceratosolen solmsi marchali]|uniref:Zinc finger and BTB domain-containing protein 49 isoform X3 n=1 Tax=Ceratosolen solmsi marchali TaxID=326594 RepID=A0AAJ6YXG7_9HYME|nr:PREDICTED: zinc finger and BTB domain-containing protein 49 isoform X3 [Ceratosolen solmsi marchali]